MTGKRLRAQQYGLNHDGASIAHLSIHLQCPKTVWRFNLMRAFLWIEHSEGVATDGMYKNGAS